LFHVIIPDYGAELLEICSLVASLQGFDTLSGDSQRVGDGHADAARSYVEAEDSSQNGNGGWAGMGILVVGIVLVEVVVVEILVVGTHRAIMRGKDFG
jgi:hypothetical protein